METRTLTADELVIPLFDAYYMHLYNYDEGVNLNNRNSDVSGSAVRCIKND